jgi:RNA polymerase sigma-70 factor (ECF subfamily)
MDATWPSAFSPPGGGAGAIPALRTAAAGLASWNGGTFRGKMTNARPSDEGERGAAAFARPGALDDLEALVVAARAGNAAAQERLIEAYQKRLGGFVYGMVSDPAQVDDLCQTIFVKTVLSLHQLRDAARFEAWFFRLARNCCLSHLRRDKFRRLFSPLLPGHEEVAAAPSREESPELALLRAALRALPEKQRALLLLVQDREQHYEELAAAAGIGVGAFKTRVHRAKLALKERIAHVRQRTLE